MGITPPTEDCAPPTCGDSYCCCEADRSTRTAAMSYRRCATGQLRNEAERRCPIFEWQSRNWIRTANGRVEVKMSTLTTAEREMSTAHPARYTATKCARPCSVHMAQSQGTARYRVAAAPPHQARIRSTPVQTCARCPGNFKAAETESRAPIEVAEPSARPARLDTMPRC